jgi:hypothetical protein
MVNTGTSPLVPRKNRYSPRPAGFCDFRVVNTKFHWYHTGSSYRPRRCWAPASWNQWYPACARWFCLSLRGSPIGGNR